MNRLFVFSVITIFLLTFSIKCKKEDQLKSYTIKGRLMSSCNYPASNKSMFISQLYGQLTGTGGHLKDFSCDANGYFSVEYHSENTNKIDLGVYGASYIVEDIPAEQDIDLGNVYITPTTNFIIKLQVNNSYTSLDTLFYTNYVLPITTNAKKIAGPFQNTTLDSIKNIPIFGPPLTYGSNSAMMSVRYHIKGQLYKDVDFNVNLCDTNYKIVVLTID